MFLLEDEALISRVEPVFFFLQFLVTYTQFSPIIIMWVLSCRDWVTRKTLSASQAFPIFMQTNFIFLLDFFF